MVARSAVVRAGLEAMLRAHPDIQVVAAAASFAGIPSGADVVLAEHPLADEAPPLPVILLGESEDSNWITGALRSGARGALSRESGSEEICAAILAAAAGLAVLPADALERLLPERPAMAEGQPLTPRETEVLRMLAEGLGNKEVAWRLGISDHTVKFHIASIFSKLNVSSRTEAVTNGVRLGLVLL